MRPNRVMKRRTKPGEVMGIAAFQDIAFLLLIFFILVMSLTQHLGMLADIPAGKRSEKEPEKTNTVQLNEGKVIFNEKPITMNELGSALTALKLEAQPEGKRIVLLEMGKGVNYQMCFDVMVRIQSAGGVVTLVKDE